MHAKAQISRAGFSPALPFLPQKGSSNTHYHSCVFSYYLGIRGEVRVPAQLNLLDVPICIVPNLSVYLSYLEDAVLLVLRDRS